MSIVEQRNHHCYDFVQACCEVIFDSSASQCYIARGDLYRCYVAWAKVHMVSILNQTNFGRGMHYVLGDEDPLPRCVRQGKLVYRGIRFTEQATPYLPAALVSAS